jgi:hypothetical protein
VVHDEGGATELGQQGVQSVAEELGHFLLFIEVRACPSSTTDWQRRVAEIGAQSDGQCQRAREN